MVGFLAPILGTLFGSSAATAATIGVAGKLIGGALQNRAARKGAAQERGWALEDQAEQFVRLRSAAEKGGFNPLTALMANPQGGMPRATAAASADYMGSAIADSALILADSYSKTQAAKQGAKLQAVAAERDALQRKLTAATLRPTMPGVYGIGGRNGRPTSSAVSNGGGFTFGSAFAGSPLLVNAPLDPRRKVDVAPIVSDGGFMVIDNPAMEPFNVPAVNGEIPDIWQYPTIAAGWAGTRAYNAGLDYASYLWKQNLLDQYKPGRKYRPSPKAGYDALTGSTFPAARILQ